MRNAILMRTGTRLLFFASVSAVLLSFSGPVPPDTAKTVHAVLRPDTSSVGLKKFSPEQINTLKADPDLHYDDPPTVAGSLWSQFVNWLREVISGFLRTATTTGVGKAMIYVLGLVVGIYLLRMALRVNAVNVFFKRHAPRVSPEAIEENLHEMDFEKLIPDAVAKSDFRVATRMIFLYSLKILADRHVIEWNPSKTNLDYVQEIREPELRTGFAELSHYFGYAWYGNFTVTRETFDVIHTAFYDWRAKVQ
jgi:hypothetical protein